MTDYDYAIQAEGLVKRFGPTTALVGVDLAVRPGTVLGLLGPNGAGKTTTIRILATLLRPDAGWARVAGHDVLRQARRVRSLIGLTGQYAALDEELTGVENLVLIGRLLELPRRRARQRAEELLERFDIAEAGRRLVRTYSGGMRRRLDLAASLVGHPRVLYLDEPTTGLDPRSRTELWKMVQALVVDGTAVLLTTQYLDEADRLADEITVIDRGRVIAAGTPEALRAKIGGQTIEVRPRNPAHVDATAAIVAALTSATPAVDPDTGQVAAPVSDPAVAPVVLRRLDETGVALTELSVRAPSLDEVYLALTGNPAGGAGGSR